VELLGERRGRATAHVAGSSGLLRLRPGDEVVVELLPYDMTRGRIVRRRP
jgi:translation initiation factor IF-1